jgi:hypothetical protein
MEIETSQNHLSMLQHLKNVISTIKIACHNTYKKELVRLSFQPLIFSQPAVFFSHINQPTVLSTAYFQPSEQAVKLTSCNIRGKIQS